MRDTFCPIPWTFLAVRNNGDLRVCCQANVSTTRGLLRDSSGHVLNARSANLTAARNSNLMKQTRLDMMSGRWPASCSRCKSEEEAGLVSRRSYERENWKLTIEDFRQSTSCDGTIDTTAAPLRYFDVRFGNKCNLACRMCGPTDSDFWYPDYAKLMDRNWFDDTHGRVLLKEHASNRFTVTENGYDWYDSPEFWIQMGSMAQQLKHIYMAGGEPLLIDQHYEFLQNCIDQGYSKNIILEYNTNLTVLPAKALDMWEKFHSVRLGISLDGIGDVLEYQRYPAKWSVLERNIQSVNANSSSRIWAWLACTVTIYNIWHLPDFIDWKLQANLENINRGDSRPIITHHMAHKPEHLNVRALPQHLKEKVHQRFENYLADLKPRVSARHFIGAQKILTSVENFMNAKSYTSEHWPHFLSFTEKIDQIRGQSIKTVCSWLDV